jgi:hypothetical protein
MVLPNLVVGTLRLGFDMLRGLTEPFARGLFLHCLIAEVHPFDDGNGRMSRLHFTSELLRGEQAHVIIPTVFRDDYIGGMRSLSWRGDPALIARACQRAQQVTASIQVPTASTSPSLSPALTWSMGFWLDRPNAIVQPIYEKAMLLILTTDEERNVDDARAAWDEAKALTHASHRWRIRTGQQKQWSRLEIDDDAKRLIADLWEG